MLSLTEFISFISALSLGILVLKKKHQNRANGRFAVFAFVLSGWSFGAFVMGRSVDSTTALFWIKFHEMFLVFIPSTFYHFVIDLTGAFEEKIWQKICKLGYIWSAILLALVPTPFFTSGTVHYSWGYFFPKAALGQRFFSLFFLIFVSISVYRLIISQGQEVGHRRNQLRYVLFAAVSGLGTGLASLLPFFGLPVFPLGFVGVTISVALVTYAIIKYHLMDIKIVINKGLVYSALTSALTGIYFLIIFVFGKVLHETELVKGAFLSPVVAFTVLAFVFKPLREKIQFVVDTRFFKTTYDYQETLKAFSRSVITILDLDELANSTVELLTQSLKIKNVSLFLWDETKGRYVPSSANLSDISSILKPLKSQVVIPIISKNSLIAFISLGEKFSGDIYSQSDFDLFKILANQLAIAIENAKLYRLAITSRRSQSLSGDI